MRLLIVLSLLLTPLLGGALVADPANEAPDGAVGKLEESGASIHKIAADDERLQVDFHLAGDKFQDDMLAPIEGLTTVYELHLGGTPLTDAGLAHVSGLTSLERLHLNNTKITDAGLENLSGLANLQYLNLYADEITDAGLEHLSGLKNLKKLYLWQTKVTDDGVAKLKTALPDLDVNRGWDLKPAAGPDAAAAK